MDVNGSGANEAICRCVAINLVCDCVCDCLTDFVQLRTGGEVVKPQQPLPEPLGQFRIGHPFFSFNFT